MVKSFLHNSYQTTFWTLIKLIHDYCNVRYYEKKRPKIFFQWKFCLFSRNFVFNNLSGPKKWSHRFHSSCRNTLWTPSNCCLRLVTLDKSRKNGPIAFFIVKIHFLYSLFLSTSGVLKNWSYYSHSKCQKILWNPIECFLMLIILDKSRKFVQFVFSSEKFAFFSKNCVCNNLVSVTDMIS